RVGTLVEREKIKAEAALKVGPLAGWQLRKSQTLAQVPLVKSVPQLLQPIGVHAPVAAVAIEGVKLMDAQHAVRSRHGLDRRHDPLVLPLGGRWFQPD